jgi:hypothetical protein
MASGRITAHTNCALVRTQSKLNEALVGKRTSYVLQASIRKSSKRKQAIHAEFSLLEIRPSNVTPSQNASFSLSALWKNWLLRLSDCAMLWLLYFDTARPSGVPDVR